MSVTTSVSSAERRHDLDALRAAAMLLGIALHAAIPYAPFFPWAIQDSQTSESFSLLFAVIHGFRMPLFFLISGFFTAMIWRQKGLASLLRQRALRILVPCLLASITILPLMSWITRQVAPAPKPLSAPASAEPPAITTLTEAIRQASTGMLEQLIAQDPSAVNQPDAEMNVQPLAWASMHGNAEAVRLLLAAGADLNGRNGDGSTALHGAVFTGQPTVLRLLLEHGADPVAKNFGGQVPAQSGTVDANAAAFIWGLLRLPPRSPEDVIRGREECLAMLPPPPSTTAVEATDLTTEIRNAYMAFITASTWQFASLTRSGQAPFHLFLSPVFDHLWFLWFLCWMVVGFALLIEPCRWLLRRLGISSVGLARLLTVSPLKLMFLIPTVMMMMLMGLFGPSFGPDTSFGLLPQPHVLLYYSVFFFFGCLYFIADDRDGSTGRFWWLGLPIAAVLFMLNFKFEDSRLAASALQAAYAWLMSFGCLGVARRFLGRPSVSVRWMSDASYWLYVTHLPLLFVIQAPLREFGFSPWLKFGLACLTCTGLLLVVYQYAVRYSWLGTLLNGPRRRTIRDS
jgi:hypothetical protein